jgi:hypothetical protein
MSRQLVDVTRSCRSSFLSQMAARLPTARTTRDADDGWGIHYVPPSRRVEHPPAVRGHTPLRTHPCGKSRPGEASHGTPVGWESDWERENCQAGTRAGFLPGKSPDAPKSPTAASLLRRRRPWAATRAKSDTVPGAGLTKGARAWLDRLLRPLDASPSRLGHRKSNRFSRWVGSGGGTSRPSRLRSRSDLGAVAEGVRRLPSPALVVHSPPQSRRVAAEQPANWFIRRPSAGSWSNQHSLIRPRLSLLRQATPDHGPL